MNTALDTIRSAILAPAGLDDHDLDRALGCLLGHRIDAADLYFQVRRVESWSLEDGAVKGGQPLDGRIPAPDMRLLVGQDGADRRPEPGAAGLGRRAFPAVRPRPVRRR